jgi:hypothetical protein
LNIIINFEKKTMCSNEKPARRPVGVGAGAVLFASALGDGEYRSLVPHRVK